MSNRIKKGTIITIGNKKAHSHNYSSVIGERARVVKFVSVGIGAYYEVELEDFEGWDSIWYIQPDDCIPFHMDNKESIRFMKEEVDV